jgi:hypothetical protein
LSALFKISTFVLSRNLSEHFATLFQWVHCIYAACLFKDAGADKSGFFQRLIGLAIQTFGGGIWVGLLLGQPPGMPANFSNFMS